MKESKAICAPPAACLPVKPIPYSEKPVLPLVVAPPVRHGPKVKTRGVSNLITLPAPAREAVHVIPRLTPYDVPKEVLDTLERIFIPQEKGKVSIPDLKRVRSDLTLLGHPILIYDIIGHEGAWIFFQARKRESPAVHSTVEFR